MFGLGNRGRLAAMRAILFTGIALGGIVSPGWCAEFVVNSIGDEPDANPGDNVAEILPGSAITTLRAAIEEANASNGPDLITFAAGTGDAIQLRTALPPLSDPTGGTTIRSNGATFPISGTDIPFTIENLGGGTLLDGNTLDRQAVDYASACGIRIESADNRIEGLRILRFPQDGIQITGASATGNVIRSIFVGMNGNTRAGNGRHGIYIADGASNNTVGGMARLDRNVIGDNGQDGIHIAGAGASGNAVLFNVLGSGVLELPDCIKDYLQGLEDLEGSCVTQFDMQRCTSISAPNKRDNIRISNGASDNMIGGEGALNVITGSIWYPPSITSQYCTDYGVPAYCTVDPDIRPSSGIGVNGVTIEGEQTGGNQVAANQIGYRHYWELGDDAYGAGLREGYDRSGNAVSSVAIQSGAADNIIGGSEDVLGNTINYSLGSALVLTGLDTTGNRVLNNTIHGEKEGIVLDGGASGNQIGDANGGGNLIAARQHGIAIRGGGTQQNVVVGNSISLNGFSGVAIYGAASGNFIGGDAPGEGNHIVGNCSDGVILYDPNTAANQILGNTIQGNGEVGVFIITGASDNIIGGSTEGAGNDIVGNEVTGVEIHNVGTTGNQVLGNDIHDNGTRGVFLVDGTSGNVVGGEPATERNRIYENTLSGIEVNGALTAENKIRINSIYDNGTSDDKGIDLTFGANQDIQPPVIERFVPFSGTAAPGSFVDAFADTAEEGRTYIGTANVDQSGRFSAQFNLIPHRNLNLTATATDLDGNTSEFSAPVAIIAPTFPSVPADRVIVVGDDLTLSVTVAGSPEIALQWEFRPSGGDRVALEDGDAFSGVTTETLTITSGQLEHEGDYICVADNGLGAVDSPSIFVRVVSADLNELQVNSLSDVSDGDTSYFGRLLASPGADGVVSLREAITAANTMPGDNTIRFAVEGAIAVESPLPAISDATGALTLDGGAVLSLDGGALSGAGSGLTVTSAGNRIAGLGVYHFPEHGLVLSGSGATDNTIAGCKIGTDGSTAKANGGNGILLTEGASDNLVGGTGEGDGNLIGGNGNAGVALQGAGTSGNRLQGNTIGDPSLGEGGNALAGVYLTDRASDNVVGGTLPEQGNTIAGNTGIGVYVAGTGTSGNTIRNNSIHDNGDLGIRLFEGGNDGLARPVVQGLDPVAGTAPANSVLEGFMDGAEEGEVLLFTATAGADGAFELSEDLSAYDGSYLTLTATDASGNTSAFSAPFPIDFTNPELALNGAPSVTLECGQPYDDPGAAATDNLDGDITANVVAALLDGNGEDAGTVESAPPGTYTLQYTVSDASGLAATPVTRAVTIRDTTAPVLTLTGADTMNLTCGAIWEDPGATAEDACEGPLTVVVSGAVDTSAAGVYTLTYTAEDGAGNEATPVTRTVTLVDEEEPVITLLGEAAQTVSCGEAYTDPGATAEDACAGAVDVTRSGMVDGTRAGLYTLSYDAVDASGNHAATVTRSVTVADATAPLLTLNGEAEVTITCGQGYAEQGATLTDACDPGTDVTVSGDFNPNAAGIYTLYYDATDGAGNVAETITRTVTVLGGSAPVILLSGDASVSVPCNTVYQDAGARATDGCQTDITAAIMVDNPVDTSQPGTYTVTYTVEDGAGAAATPVTRTVIVLPCVAPCDGQCAGEPDDLIDGDGDGLSLCKERCLGASDSNPDTDGDGMPDGFEYENRLNALVDDGDQDPDLDGTSNADEFLEEGAPRDGNSPRATFFVSPLGMDLPEAGTRENPWQTIGYAMGRIRPTAANPVRLFLDAGLYGEDVTVKSYAELQNNVGAEVELMGTTVMRANSTVRGLTFTSTESSTGILFVEGGIAAVRDCTLNGEFGTNLTGIAIESGSSPRSVIEGTLFQHLDTGIDVSGALPAVRQCAFADIAVAAILVRDGAAVAATDSEMGQGLNGWNDFGSLGGGLAILNQTGANLSAQWNDWGTESATEQQALVQGAVNQGNALAVGGASAAAALEVVVSNGANQGRISGASVMISGASGTLSVTTGADGRVALPTLPAGAWQIAVTATGFPDSTQNVTVQAGARQIVNAVLIKDDGETPEPTGPSCPGLGKSTGAPANARGDLVLFGLLIACLAIGKMGRAGGRE